MTNCINSASYQKQDGKKSEKEQWGYSGSFGDFLCCWWGLKRFRVLERAQGRVRGENNQNLYFSQQLSSHLIQLLLFIQKHAFITLANNYNSQHRLLSHSGASASPAATPQTTPRHNSLDTIFWKQECKWKVTFKYIMIWSTTDHLSTIKYKSDI